MGDICAQLVIYWNKFSFINHDTGIFCANFMPVWTAPNRHQDTVINLWFRRFLTFEGYF